MTFTNGFEDWNSKEDAVYDKVRSGVVAAKEMSERAIRLDERNRIIKLLLEHPLCVDVDYINYCDCSEEATEMDYKDHLIALIKGEAN